MAGRYSLKLKTIEIPIEVEEGQEVTFTIKELTGKQRDEFLNDQSKRAGKEGGMPKNFTGVFSSLLKLCLYDPTGNLVPVAVIDSWPSELSTELFMQAVALSGLNKKAEELEKNS